MGTRPQLCLEVSQPRHGSSFRDPQASHPNSRAPSMAPTSSQHHLSVDDLPTEIIPRLYIGDLCQAENKDVLQALRITHVLSAMGGTVRLPDLPIKHYKISLMDAPFTELAEHLPASTSFLREALRDENARVLVHCFRGVSRSASIVAAFLIAKYGWSTAQAVHHVKSKRLIAEPNFGFVGQLKEYARMLGHTS